MTEFAKFLQAHQYDTKMWEHGYSPDDVNEVCHELSAWASQTFGLQGEFIVLWAEQDGITFAGDSELAYADAGTGYLLPNPFIEGDVEGFVVGLQHIVNGDMGDLYQVEVRGRVLYNAV